jgi:hypothetical protein
MSTVGRDVEAEEGLRVVITEEGRNWDINKAKRGDSSQGGAGTIFECRDSGKVLFCCFCANLLYSCSIYSKLSPPFLLSNTF